MAEVDLKQGGKLTPSMQKDTDDFAKAWEEDGTKDGNKSPESDPEKKKKDDAPPADEVKPGEEKPASIVRPVPDAPPSDPDKQPDNVSDSQEVAKWKAKAEELQQAMAALEHKMKSWEGRITAANGSRQAAEDRAAKAEKRIVELESQVKGPKDLPGASDDDDTTISDFVKEYPDLERPLRALVRKEAATLVKKATPLSADKPATSDASPDDPALSSEKQTEEDVKAHWEAIRKAHPEADQWITSGAITRWVAVQPPLLRRQFEGVNKSGTAREAIEMLDLFKESLPKAAPKPNSETDPNPADSLEAVPHTAGGPPSKSKEVSKEDYDGAWAALEAVDRKKPR